MKKTQSMPAPKTAEEELALKKEKSAHVLELEQQRSNYKDLVRE